MTSYRVCRHCGHWSDALEYSCESCDASLSGSVPFVAPASAAVFRPRPSTPPELQEVIVAVERTRESVDSVDSAGTDEEDALESDVGVEPHEGTLKCSRCHRYDRPENLVWGRCANCAAAAVRRSRRFMLHLFWLSMLGYMLGRGVGAALGSHAYWVGAFLVLAWLMATGLSRDDVVRGKPAAPTPRRSQP